MTSARTRLVIALSYDAALRRLELVTLDTTDIDPAHRLIGFFDAIAEARRQGTVAVAPMLGERMSVSAIALDDSGQPDQLTSRAIQQLVHDHAVPKTGEAP